MKDRYDIAASKHLAWEMSKKHKGTKIENKKGYNRKKERRKNKIKLWDGE